MMKKAYESLTAGSALLLAFLLSSALAWAQDGPVVLQVAGKAQILEAGRRFEVKEGLRLSPGQSIRLIGGGEVRLSAAGGKIAIKVLGDSTVKYDGQKDANERPWADPVPGYQRTSTTDGKKVPQFSVPIGRLEVEVQPGQELRMVCPLIMAAVRGTRFTVTVEQDGTSRVETFEGQVAAYGRNGEIRLTMAGQRAEVSARDYTAHLAANGVVTPRGGWRHVPARSQERVDDQTLGVIFGPDGGDLLTAVLANPNASPTTGINALAIESSSIEPGSLFVEDFGNSDSGGGELRIQPMAAAIEPESTLLDQGLPDLQPPQSPSADNRYGWVIGFFNLPGATVVDSNKLIFELDFATGNIINAGFDVSYLHPHSVYGTAKTELGASDGSGKLNLRNLHFSISNFASYHNSYYENSLIGTASEGTLAASTVMSGSFASPLNFDASLNGQVAPVYVPNLGSPAPTSDMPLALNFVGSLNEKAFYDVQGHFFLPASSVNENWYYFSLDINDGRIFDADAGINFLDSASNSVQIDLEGGYGQMTSSNFNVHFPRGEASGSGGSPFSSSSVTANMNGAMNHDRDHTGIGTQVTSGNIAISYGSPAPTYMPTTLNIEDGEVTRAGAP
ncbi:MAG: FecR family protein [Deltaproteobacteria bacterium]|jgi:hypothetical protein|nr:FecR family protein [Deltaproteobacteria bacterium]